MPRVWIDIDNPPQVQYLFPFAAAFRRRGAEAVVTARDYGNAIELLSQRTSSFHTVGAEFGKSTFSKTRGAVRRAHALLSLFKRIGQPDVLLSASRSSALAARRLGIDSFIISDYERANRSFYRLTGSYLLYPDVIDPRVLREGGLRASQLIPFHGLKEDVSFAGVDLDMPAATFSQIDDEGLVRVLFRPPSEASHYYDPQSRELALSTLGHLASRPDCVVVFSPRHDWQRRDLDRFTWRRQPVVLDHAVPFVSLLKAVDLVVCSGGTMLREAAYLGIPAVSIFKSHIGAVDRYLESIGRVQIVSSASDLARIRLEKAPPLAPLRANPALLDELAELVLEHAAGRAPVLDVHPSAEEAANELV